MQAPYDVIVIGGGPAGLTAGLYTSRAGLRTLLVEQLMPGGQAATTDMVENYPGFPEGIAGPELMQRFEQQAVRFGLEVRIAQAQAISVRGRDRIVSVGDEELVAGALIIASGSSPRKLGVPGEDAFRGRGVSYCATCDGPLYRDAVLAMVGGGDSAVKEGIFLTKFARKVYLIHRRDELRASGVTRDRALSNEKIEFVWNSVVEEIVGEQMVSGVRVRNVKTREQSTLPVDGVFIFVGTEPNTGFVKGILKLDEKGTLVTNRDTETLVPGIFAAGDVQEPFAQQIAVAVGHGAQAAMMAEHYLAEQRRE
ncbi:MAG: thioredoxin-disulfide reductase [Candidatus Latescibacterota bacterium]|nr:MAG: thioredoxin-disulfide reductase [Candidatus Latescibacteria bacterium 4484_107]RKY72714.1 MAG: thioredoxin-disulfide reductase [Candidatus Latescibacterota bacterium]